MIKMKKLFILLGLVFLFSLMSSYAITTDGNVGYWDLNNNLLDSSTNGNDFTNNGATYTASGKLQGAYDFDGTNDYMSSSADLSTGSALSWGAWIKTTGTDAPGS